MQEKLTTDWLEAAGFDLLVKISAFNCYGKDKVLIFWKPEIPDRFLLGYGDVSNSRDWVSTDRIIFTISELLEVYKALTGKELGLHGLVFTGDRPQWFADVPSTKRKYRIIQNELEFTVSKKSGNKYEVLNRFHTFAEATKGCSDDYLTNHS